jgi:hypothetical protein
MIMELPENGKWSQNFGIGDKVKAGDVMLKFKN